MQALFVCKLKIIKACACGGEADASANHDLLSIVTACGVSLPYFRKIVLTRHNFVLFVPYIDGVLKKDR